MKQVHDRPWGHGSWDDLSSWHEEEQAEPRPRGRGWRGRSVLVFVLLAALAAAAVGWANGTQRAGGYGDCRPQGPPLRG